MNKKQIAMLAVTAGTVYTAAVFFKILNIVHDWDKADQATVRHERRMEELKESHALFDRIEKSAEIQNDTAKFWNQVTHD